MSIYKKDHKNVWESFDPKPLFESIIARKSILAEVNLLVSRELSMEFSELINSSDSIYEKCEIILMLLNISNSNAWDMYQNLYVVYPNLKDFFELSNTKVVLNKMFKFIEVTGYDVVKISSSSKMHFYHKDVYSSNKISVIELVPTEISVILDEISDASLSEMVLEYRKSASIADKAKQLHAIQKPYYSKLRSLQKTKEQPYGTLNLKMIQRRTEVFLRHADEANDKDLKKYYDDLSKEQKIKELDFLFFDWLHLIQIFKQISLK